MHLMKLFTWFFLLLTLAQFAFTFVWVLLTKKFDKVIILSSIIYAGVMIIGYIAYEVEKYRKRKKQLLDDLP